MPLFSTLASLSQTAASNAADGSTDAPSTIDNQLNLLASFIAQLRDGVGITPYLGDRNLLVNSNFSVNQRLYVSGTATTIANQVTLDRWRVVTSSQSITFGAASPDRVVTAPAGGVEQIIEGGWVVGGVYTLSWTGTATATVNGVAITSGGQTSALPANTNVTIRFSGGTVDRAQFELGAAATPWQRRPPHIELLLCQRDYQKSYGLATIPGAATTAGAFFAAGNLASSITANVRLMTPMKAVPTIRLWDTAGAANAVISFTSAGVQTSRSASASGQTDQSFNISASLGTDVVITGHWDAATGV